MKCDDYQVQRPNTTNLNARPQIEINQQQSLDQPPVKRKCIENGVIVETINGPAQTKQLTVDKTQRSTARLSKSMSKIGSQISIQKMTSVHSSVNVATPALNTSVPATTATATASASNANQFKIKNVKSLHQPATVITAVTANNPLNSGDPQKTIENGLAPGGSAKKVRVIKTSKIPGRSNGVLVKPVTLVSTAQVVNAQSTPNRPVQTTKRVNFIPEDPLKIDTPTTAAVAAALPELTIEPIISAEIVRPAFVKEVKILQTNSKQLSTSLPLMAVSTAAAAAATTTMTTTPGRTMITRSRNNTEHPKQLYKCESCAFTTEVEQNLMRHSLLHTGDKPQVCKTCKKRFPRKPLLLAHMREYHHELHSDLAYWDTN